MHPWNHRNYRNGSSEGRIPRHAAACSAWCLFMSSFGLAGIFSGRILAGDVVANLEHGSNDQHYRL